MAKFEAEAFLRDVLGADNIRVSGDELRHNCLLMSHQNDYKEPGASLNAEKLLYNCWKCGSGGTLLWLVGEVLQTSSAKARKIIQGSFDALEQSSDQSLMETEKMWAAIPNTDMPRYNLRMLKGWICQTKYLDDRGVSREVQKEMLTGIYKDNKDELSGVSITQPRIVIPHIYEKVLRGWTMRLINDDVQVGTKYKHTSQFPKQNTLYNFDSAKKYDSLVVVESPLSVLRLKSEGIHNVVGTFGAEVNPKQVDLIAMWDEVTLFPDGDRSGYRALRQERRGNVVGLIHNLSARTNLWVVDHGRTGNLDEWGFNNKDAADYTGTELRDLFEQRVSVSTWDFVWRDNVNQEASQSQDRSDYVSLGDIQGDGAWD